MAQTAQFLAAHLYQEAVEGDSGQIRVTMLVAFSPMFLSAEQVIRARVFYGVFASLLAKPTVSEANHPSV